MKKIYENLFRIPEDGKIREKVMNARIALAVVVISVCLFSMGITAYAFFSCTVTSGISIIKSARFYLDERVTEVTPEGEEPVVLTKGADGYYVLDNKKVIADDVAEAAEEAAETEQAEDKLFAIQLTKPDDVTASVGFAKIEILTDEKQVYYTEPIYKAETTDEYLLYVCVPADKSVKVRIVDNWGTCARGPVVKNGMTFTPDFADAMYMHLSFDDVEYSLTNLAKHSYDSIYEEPFFAWLKDLHETYGAKFSLYTYTSVLTEHRDALKVYQKEFAEAEDWLKFGLHAEEKDTDFSGYTAEEGAAAWDEFVKEVVQITGTSDSVDRMPRLHAFAGSKEALKGMQGATNGALGFLAADDARNSYYLGAENSQYLYTNDYYIDQTNNQVFVATDLRLDWFETEFTSQYMYRAPSKGSVYEELNLRYQSEEYEDSRYSYLVFGHEWQFYDADGFIEEGDAGEIWKGWIEEVCRFANENSVYFHYPQEKEFALPEVTEPAEQSEVAEPTGQTEDTETQEEENAPVEETVDENVAEEPSTETTNPEEAAPEDTTTEDTTPAETEVDGDTVDTENLVN